MAADTRATSPNILAVIGKLLLTAHDRLQDKNEPGPTDPALLAFPHKPKGEVRHV